MRTLKPPAQPGALAKGTIEEEPTKGMMHQRVGTTHLLNLLVCDLDVILRTALVSSTTVSAINLANWTAHVGIPAKLHTKGKGTAHVALKISTHHIVYKTAFTICRVRAAVVSLAPLVGSACFHAQQTNTGISETGPPSSR
jgi:hypothetical protein